MREKIPEQLTDKERCEIRRIIRKVHWYFSKDFSFFKNITNALRCLKDNDMEFRQINLLDEFERFAKHQLKMSYEKRKKLGAQYGRLKEKQRELQGIVDSLLARQKNREEKCWCKGIERVLIKGEWECMHCGRKFIGMGPDEPLEELKIDGKKLTRGKGLIWPGRQNKTGNYIVEEVGGKDKQWRIKLEEKE